MNSGFSRVADQTSTHSHIVASGILIIHLTVRNLLLKYISVFGKASKACASLSSRVREVIILIARNGKPGNSFISTKARPPTKIFNM